MILIKMEKKWKIIKFSVLNTSRYAAEIQRKKAPTTKHSSATQLWENDDKINAQRSFYLEPVKKSLWALGIESKTAQWKEGYNICTKLGLSCSQKATTKEWHRVPVFHAFLKTTTTSTTTSDLQPTFHVVHFWHANTVHFQQEELIPFTYFQ